MARDAEGEQRKYDQSSDEEPYSGKNEEDGEATEVERVARDAEGDEYAADVEMFQSAILGAIECQQRCIKVLEAAYPPNSTQVRQEFDEV